MTGTVATAEMQERADGEQLGQPLALSPARILSLPQWMDVLALRHRRGDPADFFRWRLPATTRAAQSGMIAFSMNDHMLLDPDKLEALVLTVEMVKRLLAPQDLQVVSTGGSVSVPAIGVAKITAPDGSVREVRGGRDGPRARTSDRGRAIQISSVGTKALIYADYHDAGESDLRRRLAPESPHPPALSDGAATIGEPRCSPG